MCFEIENSCVDNVFIQTIDNFVVGVIVITKCFVWLWTIINLVCVVTTILSHTITINIIEFDFGVLTILTIVINRHFVSYNFMNFWFCYFKYEWKYSWKYFGK